jgi:hypothetical protein
LLRFVCCASLALSGSVAGCGTGFLRDVALDGPYRLVAVDHPEDMLLCRSVGTEGDCLGDGLAGGATVFQAGANAKFIVVARHPRRWPEAADRSISEFYYVIRSASEPDPLAPLTVVGPMNKLEYDKESERLGLPDFTKIFEDLK